MKLIKAMVTVGGITLVSRVAGFLRDVLSARILGAGPVADAFFIALKLPNFFRRITAEGAFAVSFIPLYTASQEESEDAANDFARNAMGVMVAILLPFTLICMLGMPAIMWAMAPGFEGVRLDLATLFARITFPYLLLMSLTALIGGVLNAHDRFAPFAAAPIFFNLTMVACLLLSNIFFPTAGHALAWGVTIAGVVQLVWIWGCAKRRGLIMVPTFPKITPKIKRLFTLMLPAAIGAGVVQINLFVDVIIASFLPTGAVSHLYYAERLNQLPLGIVGVAIGTALLPMLSRAVAQGDAENSQNLFNRALEACLFITVPAATALALAAWPIISVLFRHGAFTAHDAQITASVLSLYALGLPAYVAAKIYATAAFARQDTKTPVIVAALSAICNAVLAITFIFGFDMGVMGLGLATSIAGWVQLGFLAWMLSDVRSIEFDARFRRVLPRVVLATAIMGVAVYALSNVLQDAFLTEGLTRIVALLALCGAGGMLYFAVVFATKALTFHDIKNYFTKPE